MKFKVGDKVRIINNIFLLDDVEIGDIATVMDTTILMMIFSKACINHKETEMARVEVLCSECKEFVLGDDYKNVNKKVICRKCYDKMKQEIKKIKLDIVK